MSFSEIMLVLIVAVILFRGKKISELARALGRAAYEFKKAKETIENEVNGIAQKAKKEAEGNSKPVTSAEKKEETDRHAG